MFTLNTFVSVFMPAAMLKINFLHLLSTDKNKQE